MISVERTSMEKSLKETIFVEEFFDQFRLIDLNLVDVSRITDLAFRSNDPDKSFYVATKPDSEVMFKPNVINMQREMDIPMLTSMMRYGLNIPPFVHATTLSGMFPYLESDKKYLIKSMGAARSLGQMITSKDEIFTIIEFLASKECDAESFNARFNIDTSTSRDEHEDNFLFNRINRGNVYISELIEFESEYRVLYFQGDDEEPIIESRKGYSAGSKEKRLHEVVPLDESRLTGSVFQKLKEFGDQHPSPMLSFDVYATVDGRWGLFEYCPQFGVIYPGYYDIIGKKMTSAVLNAIENTRKADNVPRKMS